MSEPLTPVPTIPSIPVPMTMSFPDSMKKVLEGKRIARISWGNTDYCLLQDGWLSIFTKGDLHTWNINDGDMEAEDWIVVTELN